MNKRRTLNAILTALGVACPIVFPLCHAGFSAARSSFPTLWQYLLDYCQTAPIPFFGLAPLGFTALLTVLIRERERLSLFAWIPLFLLLLLNLGIAVLTLLALHYDRLW